ncbi:hypothetical protein AURDEDRAFT_117191 [Auricularia subglabra TFB-10046 SS5]|uniref:Uncharacterized protein n=1 Tax=Auricularia subglabra (strain TFB-10046 / SS5) TaxID=717982 RepID=J0LFF5_AURST|nr:hypothetical protein AURDEDRAFT_117191 [Auricularia subglabra TFB-10046 SS5]
MDAGEAFILATDDSFLRDGDIPQPVGASCGELLWQPRPQPTGPTNTFIWQTLPARMTRLQMSARPNERARFLDPASAPLPSARAVNYVYVSRMLTRYLDKDGSAVNRLSRPVRRSRRPPPPEDEHDEEDDVARRLSNKQRFENAAWHGRSNRSEGSRGSGRSGGSHGPATSGPGDMESFELLFRLTHGGRYLDYYDEQQKVVEAEKARAIDRWRLSLPKVDRGEV